MRTMVKMSLFRILTKTSPFGPLKKKKKINKIDSIKWPNRKWKFYFEEKGKKGRWRKREGEKSFLSVLNYPLENCSFGIKKGGRKKMAFFNPEKLKIQKVFDG